MKKSFLATLSLTALLASCTVDVSKTSSNGEKSNQSSTAASSSTVVSSSEQSSERSTLQSSEQPLEQSSERSIESLTEETSETQTSFDVATSESLETLASSEESKTVISKEGEIDLFDHSKSLSMDLVMSDEVMTFVSDYQSTRGKYAEAYLPADLTVRYDGEEYFFKEVGVRQKGNTSRANFFDGNSIYNLVHFKISFKATFDDELYDDPMLLPFKKTWEDTAARKARKNRNLFGYEKLDLKYIPRNMGQTVLQETYCYEGFAESGILAPKSRVGLFGFGNGQEEMSSVYQIIETVDKQFLQKRLGKQEAKGDLYKCVYNGMGPADFSRNEAVEKVVEGNRNIGERIAFGKIGVENDYEGYQPCYQLKTNDDLGEEADFSKMTNFINTLWNLIYGDGTKDELESLIDMDQFLKFSAISYLFGNPDDQRYNNNNFYIYFMPSTSKAIFIPYDWDWSLGADWEQMSSRMANLSPLDRWTLDGSDPNNLYQATFLPKEGLSYNTDEYVTKYLSYVDTYASTLLDIDKYEALCDATGIGDQDLVSVSRYMAQKLLVAKES